MVWLWKFLHCLQGLSVVKMFWCLLGGFEHKITFTSHAFQRGDQCSSNIHQLSAFHQLYAFLQLTLLSSFMSFVLSKWKTWSKRQQKCKGTCIECAWGCGLSTAKSALWQGKWDSAHLSQWLVPICTAYLNMRSRCRGALWWGCMFLIKVI